MMLAIIPQLMADRCPGWPVPEATEGARAPARFELGGSLSCGLRLKFAASAPSTFPRQSVYRPH